MPGDSSEDRMAKMGAKWLNLQGILWPVLFCPAVGLIAAGIGMLL